MKSSNDTLTIHLRATFSFVKHFTINQNTRRKYFLILLQIQKLRQSPPLWVLKYLDLSLYNLLGIIKGDKRATLNYFCGIRLNRSFNLLLNSFTHYLIHSFINTEISYINFLYSTGMMTYTQYEHLGEYICKCNICP